MLTRKQLEDLGLEKDAVDKVLDAHSADIGTLKTQLETAQQEAATHKAQLAHRAAQLETLKASTGDAEALQVQIAQLQADNKAKDEAHQAEMQALKVSAAVDAALTAAKAKNLKAVKALLDLEKAELGDDGTVKGLKDQLDKLTKAEDSKFLFDAGTKKPTVKGAAPAQSGVEDAGDGVDISKMSYEQLATFMAENPDVKI